MTIPSNRLTGTSPDRSGPNWNVPTSIEPIARCALSKPGPFFPEECNAARTSLVAAEAGGSVVHTRGGDGSLDRPVQ